MGLDRLDLIAIASIFGIVGLSTQVPRPFTAAMLGGLCCSLATWRLYGGRPWEATAWLVWTVAAIGLIVFPPGAASTVGILALIVTGTGLLLADRLSVLPAVWARPVGADDR
ncbi:hypothetical protein [Halovivax gelatinilyticus]|uniref:hypothetical protein n=1 Tax=Halovivax gelatinilyticus TaxID=2961597 RepID=UPI0020CA8488|nr:hypothetical protein [Halovivax gelatinilyticus]